MLRHGIATRTVLDCGCVMVSYRDTASSTPREAIEIFCARHGGVEAESIPAHVRTGRGGLVIKET